MATDVVMPQMGADMEEGTLLRWIKHPGDQVARGEPIAEIETDKANVEIESFDDGVLTETLVEEGQVVPVGQPIARIGAAGEAGDGALAASAPAVAPQPAAAATATAAPSGRPGQAAPPQPSVSVAPGRSNAPAGVAARRGPDGRAAAGQGDEASERLRVSPVARHLAEELGVDVDTLTGSGPDGRVMRKDVEAAAAAAGTQPREGATAPRGWSREMPEGVETAEAATPLAAAATAEVSETLTPAAAPSRAAPAEPAPVTPTRPPAPEVRPAQPLPTTRAETPAQPAAGRVEPLSRMRQAIARRMSQSKREAPHYYVTAEVDMTEAMAFRTSLNEAGSDAVHVTINDLIVKACAEVLLRYPHFNAAYTDAGLRLNDTINICIAIALPDGLIAPALLDVGIKSLGAIARESHDLGERAKNGGLRAPELNDGTFTVSNLGMYGIEMLIPIIQPPQAAILGVGAVQDKPAVRDGQIVIRKLMTVALAADHRVTDGAQGGEFLRELKRTLEHPVALAL